MKTNLLTTVPTQIQKHTLLTQVDLSFNKISIVRGGSFFFSNTLKSLNLDSNTMTTISPGAFNGKRHTQC
jgi:Leucine-rich repeat (LRR) protein